MKIDTITGAGEVADGLIAHSFTTRRYLTDELAASVRR